MVTWIKLVSLQNTCVEGADNTSIIFIKHHMYKEPIEQTCLHSNSLKSRTLGQVDIHRYFRALKAKGLHVYSHNNI